MPGNKAVDMNTHAFSSSDASLKSSPNRMESCMFNFPLPPPRLWTVMTVDTSKSSENQEAVLARSEILQGRKSSKKIMAKLEPQRAYTFIDNDQRTKSAYFKDLSSPSRPAKSRKKSLTFHHLSFNEHNITPPIVERPGIEDASTNGSDLIASAAMKLLELHDYFHERKYV